MAEPLAPERAASYLCELAGDVRAAVLLDAAGEPAGSSEDDPERARALAELARELIAAIDDAATDAPPEQVEAQVEEGIVYAVRRPEWTLVAVARRGSLSSLAFYDLRAVLDRLTGRAAA